MKTSWTTSATLSVAANPNLWFDAATSTIYLQFGRVFVNDDKNARFYVVANADGPILNAFYQASESCTLFSQSLSAARYVYSVFPTVPPGPGQMEGVIAGEIGSLPALVHSSPVQDSHTSWNGSSTWLVRWRGNVYARSWEGGAETLVQSPGLDPEKLSAYAPRAVKDAIFWEVGGLTSHGVMSWAKSSGSQVLQRWPGDQTQGAGNFGTDGIDMIWTYGQGKQPADTEYPVKSIMAAPFTPDPDVLKKTVKRLRSDPGGFDATRPWRVGCGYASRAFYQVDSSGTATSSDLLVVRINDGRSWVVNAPPLATGVKFVEALGSSCQEVFASAQFTDDAISIVRIRIDALGPGLEPD